MKKPIGQSDLFAAPAPLPTPSPPAASVPTATASSRTSTLVEIRGERPAAWERLITADGFRPKPQIIVAKNWTGVVLEDLSHPRLGRKFLHSDGAIVDCISRDSVHYLTIFLTADAARSLHVAWPLIRISHDTEAATFRLAEPGEDAPISLKLPEGM